MQSILPLLEDAVRRVAGRVVDENPCGLEIFIVRG
jgi:hypothetical protein